MVCVVLYIMDEGSLCIVSCSMDEGSLCSVVQYG